MILFKDDFRKTPYYIQNTTNKSFLRMHYVLKKMGIENNTFMLALYQKELQGVNPNALKNPSQELVTRIATECKINPWYYFREVIRIPTQGGSAIPFELNRANLALIWTFFAGKSIYLVQPRQTGKTMSTQGIASYLFLIGTKNYNLAMYTHDNKTREGNVARLKNIKDELPPYLIHINKLLDTVNKQELSYHHLNTKYITFVAQSDIMSADTIGRGGTVPFTHIDEAEFFDNLDVTYPVLSGTMTAAIKQAKEQHLPHGVIITSTAGRLESEACKYCMNMISRCAPFSEKFYDCKNQEEFDNIIDTNSTNKMVYAQFSYQQLGLTEDWLKDVIARANTTWDSILREYLCIRTSGVDNSVIPISLLEKIKSSLKDPVHTEAVNSRYIFRWYIHPDKLLNNKETVIVIGLDTSECIGKDFTSLVMIDARDMSVVCTARCNEADLIKLALFIAEFMVKNTNTFLVPERKSTASMMISIICSELRKNGINPFTRIFNTIVQHKNEEPYKSIDLNEPGLEEGPYKKYLGFVTAGSGEMSRDALYSNTLMKAVEMNYDRIHDSTLITELSSLTRKNGRIDHTASGHDDVVISFLLCSWAVYFCKNLSYYSFNKNVFLNSVGVGGSKVDSEEKERQSAILQEIIKLREDIKNMKNSSFAPPLERRLKHLESIIDSSVIDTTPISQEQIATKRSRSINRDYAAIARMYYS